jgi:hypothetical protein
MSWQDLRLALTILRSSRLIQMVSIALNQTSAARRFEGNLSRGAVPLPLSRGQSLLT